MTYSKKAYLELLELKLEIICLQSRCAEVFEMQMAMFTAFGEANGDEKAIKLSQEIRAKEMGEFHKRMSKITKELEENRAKG